MNNLTPREKELLKLLKTSLSNKEIGKKMNISINTVKVMNTKLFKKLGIANRLHLLAK